MLLSTDKLNVEFRQVSLMFMPMIKNMLVLYLTIKVQNWIICAHYPTMN